MKYIRPLLISLLKSYTRINDVSFINKMSDEQLEILYNIIITKDKLERKQKRDQFYKQYRKDIAIMKYETNHMQSLILQEEEKLSRQKEVHELSKLEKFFI